MVPVFFVRTFYVPAIVLSVWYLGWDTYYLLTSENASSINLLAHVVGGYAGYIIARSWFKMQKE